MGGPNLNEQALDPALNLNSTDSNVVSKMNENSSIPKQAKGPHSDLHENLSKEIIINTNGHLKTKEDRTPNSSWVSYLILLSIIIISFTTVPENFRPTAPTITHVWYYGWITALSTGLGAIPLFFVNEIKDRMLGICNGIAAGMMLAASYSLMHEAFENQAGVCFISERWRAFIGAFSGLLFIILTKKILDNYEDIKLGALSGMDAKKVLLIVFVMTLHSFSEGIGIGVSFGGKTGAQLGVFISLSLAVHNVPEGLAVALVLTPRKISKLNSFLWCIFTSIPQPLMAVPAFLFVEQFVPLLPVGLGFAAGAMFWVALFELFLEACEDSSKLTATLTMIAAFAVMFYLQNEISD